MTAQRRGSRRGRNDSDCAAARKPPGEVRTWNVKRETWNLLIESHLAGPFGKPELEIGRVQPGIQLHFRETDQKIITARLDQFLLNGNPASTINPEYDLGEKGLHPVRSGNHFQNPGFA